ncbi:MAG: hypothetical protein R3B13_20735 [Polyangiaceae bacterium]
MRTLSGFSWVGAAIVAAGLWLAPSVASAADAVEQGYVVTLENGDIVVDLAAARGAKVGDIIELWRPLSLRHPVTGQRVKDRFRIGSLRLTQVRDHLSLARPEGSLAREPAAGDVVLLRRVVLPVAPSSTKPSEATGALPPSTGPSDKTAPPAEEKPTAVASTDPEEREVGALFDRLRNAPVNTRIVEYERHAAAAPKGRFAAVLWEEAQYLRRLLTKGEADALISVQSFAAPKSAIADRDLSIGVEVTGPARGAVLHSRHVGEVAYVTTPLTRVGAGYFTTRLPASRVLAPEIQFFIEATNAKGESVAVVGSDNEPESVEIHEIPKPTPPKRLEATVSLWTDYADYNRLKRNDTTWQTEGYAGMRIGDDGLRALRSGFGVFRGVGGSLEDLDELGKSARRVGLTYGYLEAEYAFTDFTALSLRGIVGLRDDGVAGGAQALIRLGSDRGTNLQIGGEVLGGIGLRGITQLELNVFERVPILLRTEVTNQPAGSTASAESVNPDDPNALPTDTSLARGEVGARAIAQVGYEMWPGLVLSARGSYQGRTIKHAGPGFGGAVTYTW